MNHRLTLSLSLCVVTFYREGVLLYGRHIFSSFFSHLRFAEVFSTRRKWNSIRKIYKEEEGGEKEDKGTKKMMMAVDCVCTRKKKNIYRLFC